MIFSKGFFFETFCQEQELSSTSGEHEAKNACFNRKCKYFGSSMMAPP